MKKATTTHVLLGIIAAEVVCLTLHALAERPASGGNLADSDEESKSSKTPRRSLLGGAFHQLARLLDRWFAREERDVTPRRRLGPAAGSFTEPAGDQEGTADEVHLKGTMQGISDKLKDPAWAGVLAANQGDVSLTNAARAVPMPKSTQFMGRLDKNPYVGKGMKDHSRNKY